MSFNFERNDDATLLNSLSAKEVIDSLSIEYKAMDMIQL